MIPADVIGQLICPANCGFDKYEEATQRLVGCCFLGLYVYEER